MDLRSRTALTIRKVYMRVSAVFIAVSSTCAFENNLGSSCQVRILAADPYAPIAVRAGLGLLSVNRRLVQKGARNLG
jgi:hypothetical protein